MDLTEFEADNSRNCLVKSLIPEITRLEPCCVGIDEAGRGPVLGPMVYGICFCPLSQSERLKELGFADSKTLTEEQREALFAVIDESRDFIGWGIDILSPNYLSTSMLRRTKYSLNAISHDSAIGLIQLLIDSSVNVAEVFVDTVGPAEKYQEKLKKIFPGIEITVTPKADAKFPIVSAASICAKVGRDRVVSSWKFAEDVQPDNECGSGYPNDPATKKWMEANSDKIFGFPQLVRFSWSTSSKILEDKAVPVVWDDDDDDDENSEAAQGTASITSFFASSNGTVQHKRHYFFQERHLEQVKIF